MQREPVYAFEFEGKRYDCGNKLGYLQATVEYGLKHPSLGGDFAAYLKELRPPVSAAELRAAAQRARCLRPRAGSAGRARRAMTRAPRAMTARARACAAPC